MIVKIKSSGNGWVLFDAAKNIHYDTSPPQNPRSLQPEYDGEVHFVECTRNDLKDGRLPVCLIEFVRSGVEYAVFFSTVAYLCNDQGKTVDKVIPNVHQTRSPR